MSKFFVIMLTVCCITLMSFRLTNGDQPTTNNGDTQIHWLTFDEAVKKNQEAPKKVIVDLYTGWCTWVTTKWVKQLLAPGYCQISTITSML